MLLEHNSAKAALVAVLFLSACAPAKLERVHAGRFHKSPDSADLARALDGANDPAASKALGQWIGKNHQSTSSTPLPGYQVTIHPGGKGIYGPGYFDRLDVSADYKVIGLKDHQTEGAGVPMSGFRANKGSSSIEKYYPPEGITRAVTAIAVPGKPIRGVRQTEIRLVDRLRAETARVNGKQQALAGDFTVPFASLLENTAALQESGFISMIRIKPGRDAGFSLLEPYDPDKTPLILVHGLFSTPLAWAELTNELWAVPEIRSRYQIWHYLYPTNAPALYSARVMRGQLDELRKFLDPKGRDRAMQRTVIVSHSMGGLLSKTLAVEPKDAFWDAVFTRPLSSLDITPAERATLEEAFFWKPRGNVDRIIFCSVPFRGSNLASSWIGKLGNLLVAPDPKFQEFFRTVEKKNPDMLQPAYAGLTKGRVSSVTGLTPKQRSMEIMDQLPLTPGTAAHIITGATDWVVQRTSATVADAASNIEVPAGHGSFHHPKAIAEIIRILKLPSAR